MLLTLQLYKADVGCLWVLCPEAVLLKGTETPYYFTLLLTPLLI